MKNLIYQPTIFLVLISITIACTRIELATSWADTYIHRELDRYFDMDSLQSHFVKDSLKEDIKKIRVKIFPKLALDFESILVDINLKENYSGETVHGYEKLLRTTFKQGLEIFDQSAIEFVSKLKPEQLEKFKKEFNKKTEDIANDSNSPLKSREKRYDKIIDQLEGWIGSLTRDQKNLIRKFCQANLFPSKESVLNRNKLLNEFEQNFADRELRKKFVHKIFLDYDAMKESTYAKAIEEDQKNYFELLAQVLNIMNDDQRKHLNRTVRDRIEQLRKAAVKTK